MLQFHRHHKYLGLLLSIAPACGAQQAGGAVDHDGGAETAGRSGTESSAEAGGATAITDEPSSETGATPSGGTGVATSDGDTSSSTSPPSSASVGRSSDPASSDATSSGAESSGTESSGAASTVPAYSSTGADPSTEPPIETTGARSDDASSLPPEGTASSDSSDDAGAPPVVDSGAPGIVFEDDFDGETLANGKYEFNYAAFDRWNVIGGTVDLIAFPNELLESPGGYGDGEPANGVTVDLNGSNLHDGVIETKQAFTFHAGATYELRYSLGSPYAETNGVRAEVMGVFSTEEFQAGILPFNAYSVTFTPDTSSTAKLRFTSIGNNDNVGLVIDEVVLERLP